MTATVDNRRRERAPHPHPTPEGLSPEQALEILVVTYAMEDAAGAYELEAAIKPALAARADARRQLVVDEFFAAELCRDHFGPSYWDMLTDKGRAEYVARFNRAAARAALAKEGAGE